MGFSDWISDIKEKRALKRREQLKKDFAFLTEELYESQDLTLRRLTEQEHELWTTKTQEWEDRMTASVQSLETRLEEKSADLTGRFSVLEQELRLNGNRMISMSESMTKKVEQWDSSNRELYEKFQLQLERQLSSLREDVINREEKIHAGWVETVSDLKKGIEEIRLHADAKNGELLKALRSMEDKIGTVETNMASMHQEQKDTAKEISRVILLSTEELKDLMKIIAVNNLLNGIEVEDTTSDKKSDKKNMGGIFDSILKASKTTMEDLRKIGFFRDR